MSSTLSSTEVARAFVVAGETKFKTRVDQLFLKAFAGGVLLSFGNLLSEIAAGGSPTLNESDPGIIKIISGFVFPVGLTMIVLQGQELLTSNMMVFPMAVLKGAVPWWSLPYNWFVVFWGNMVGSLFFAALLVKYSGVVSTEPYLTYIKKAAIAKAVTPEWHQIFLRGIGCNWLVSAAVWHGAMAQDVISKIVGIWFPIWVFVSCGFDHVVANMYSLPLAIMLGSELTTAEYIKKSLFAAFFGNIVGALFVALPFTYFYLSDYDHAGGLRGIEEGEAINRVPGKGSVSPSVDESTGKRN